MIVSLGPDGSTGGSDYMPQIYPSWCVIWKVAWPPSHGMSNFIGPTFPPSFKLDPVGLYIEPRALGGAHKGTGSTIDRLSGTL
jgi:hypothetical protein